MKKIDFDELEQRLQSPDEATADKAMIELAVSIGRSLDGICAALAVYLNRTKHEAGLISRNEAMREQQHKPD